MLTNDEIEGMRARLHCMRPRPGSSSDGKGKYLGDGLPHTAGIDLRTVPLADALKELLAWRLRFSGELEFDCNSGSVVSHKA